MKQLICTFVVFAVLFFQPDAVVCQALHDTTVLRIDPNNAMGGTVSQIYDSLIYIPLENSKKCVISEVSKLEVTDKYFIVLDYEGDQIVIFNKDGSLHAKCNPIPGIHKVKNDNRYSNEFSDFSLNRNKEQIIVKSSFESKNMYLFNYDGAYAGKIPRDIQYAGFSYLQNDTIICYMMGWFEKPNLTKSNELFFSKNFSAPYDSTLPAQVTGQSMGFEVVVSGPFYYSGTKGENFFTRPYDYNIYQTNAKGIVHSYKIVLPIEYSLPANFLASEGDDISKNQYLQDNKEKVFAISHVYRIRNNLFFTLTNHDNESNKIFSYNLKTGSLVSLLLVSPDTSSYFLPVIYGFSHEGYISVQACDGEHIYSSVSSLDMFSAKEATEDKHPNYPPVLQKYFNTQTRKSNPVIVQMKPKDNL